MSLKEQLSVSKKVSKLPSSINYNNDIRKIFSLGANIDTEFFVDENNENKYQKEQPIIIVLETDQEMPSTMKINTKGLNNGTIVIITKNEEKEVGQDG